ncbi:c-type cytochrome [Microvirga sp. GCM10011540]|uniref:c-type cytochrome n=1 Tax=Microvirga sp. GCM10011540 TaxID=3317338 RepID=UPI00360E814B
MKRWSWLAVGGALLGSLAVAWSLLAPEPQEPIRIVEPATLSPAAVAGKVAYEANCAGCHGQTGAGTDRGPPLVHVIYHPGHHADAAFHVAAKSGVRQHHWRFGNMPAQPQVGDPELQAIVRYIREVQQANGIMAERHGG